MKKESNEEFCKHYDEMDETLQINVVSKKIEITLHYLGKFFKIEESNGIIVIFIWIRKPLIWESYWSLLLNDDKTLKKISDWYWKNEEK